MERGGSKGRLPDTEGARMARELTSVHALQLEVQWSLDLMPASGQREAAFRYLKERRAHGLKDGSLPSLCSTMSLFARHLGEKRFEDASNPDLVFFLARRTFEHRRRHFTQGGHERIHTIKRKSSDETIWLRTGILRAFYRFLVGEQKAAVLFEGLKVGSRPRIKVRREDLPTWEEMLAMMRAAVEPMHRALLALMADSGMRSGEIRALDIESVRFQEDGTAVIAIPSERTSLKSGAREVRVYRCVPYLKRWLAVHPRRDEAQAPFFVQRENPERRLQKGNVYGFFRTLLRRAGIERKLHPHLLRHAHATELAANDVGERLLRERNGWAPESDMPATYTHLAGDDVQTAMRRLWGLDEDASKRRGLLDPVMCPVCNAENLLDATYCCMCSKPFSRTDHEAAQQRLVKKAQKMDSLLDFLLERASRLREAAGRPPEEATDSAAGAHDASRASPEEGDAPRVGA